MKNKYSYLDAFSILTITKKENHKQESLCAQIQESQPQPSAKRISIGKAVKWSNNNPALHLNVFAINLGAS